MRPSSPTAAEVEVAPGIALRDSRPGDEAFLRSLYRSVREPELSLTPWTEAEKQAFSDSQFDLQDRWYRGQFEGARFLVILRAGEPVGRIYLAEMPRELRVMDIAIVPEARNAGIGTAVIAWAKDLAASGERAITLHVEGWNPARLWYERLGFAEEELDGASVRMRWTKGQTPKAS